MTKGTILYVGGFELPDKNAAAHRVLSNGKIFREIGFDTVFLDIDKSLGRNSDISDTFKTVHGFDCWSLSYPETKNQWINYLTNIDYMSRMIQSYPNIIAVVAYNYPSLALLNLKRFCTKRNIKVVADCTEWYSTKGTSLIFKTIKGLDSFIRMRIVQKKVDGLIVISKFLENYYTHSLDVVRVPPLVDLNEDKWLINNNRFIVNDKLEFVYSGSPGKHKDKINIFIEFLEKPDMKRDYNFNVIGITKEQYLEYYPEHRSILEKTENRIMFHGRMTHLQSLSLLKKCDFSIFVRESSRVTKAGFPTKFVESISCGIPVITSESSDLGDYLLEGRNGYFIKDKSNSFSDISEIFLNITTDEIETMKTYCMNNNPFDYRLYTDRVKDFFDNILNK